MFNIFECRNASRLLWDYIARRLPEAELEFVERHIRRCPSCRAQAEQYHRAVHLLEAYKERPEPISHVTWDDLRSRLVRERFARVPAVSRHHRRVPVLAWSGVAGAAGAVMLGVLLFNGLWRGGGRGDQHTPSSSDRVGVNISSSIPGTNHVRQYSPQTVASNTHVSDKGESSADLYRPDPDVLNSLRETNDTTGSHGRGRSSLVTANVIHPVPMDQTRPGPSGPTRPSPQNDTGKLRLVKNTPSNDGDSAHAPQPGAPNSPHYVIGTLDVQAVSYGEGSEDTHAW